MERATIRWCTVFFIISAGTTVGVACDSDESAAAVPDDTLDEKYDLEGFAERLQGTWMTPDSSEGMGDRSDVWHVDGDRLTRYSDDNQRGKTDRFRVVAPCAVGLPISARTVGDYDFKVAAGANRLVRTREMDTGLGVVTDEGAIVCGQSRIFEVTEDGCTVWDSGSRVDPVKLDDLTCSMEDGTVEIESRLFSGTLERDGDLFLSEDGAYEEMKRFDSFEKARDFAEFLESDADPPPTSGDGESATSAADAVLRTFPYDKYDLDSLAADLEGSWVVLPGETIQVPRVWSFGDEVVKTYQSFSEEVEEKAWGLRAPCAVQLIEKHSYDPEVLALGDKQRGFADVVGVSTDHGAVVCNSDLVYEVTDSGCTAWRLPHGTEVTAWVEPTCSRDGDTITVESKSHSHQLKKRGEVFLPDGGFAYEIQPADSFEDAKTKAKEMLEEQNSN